MRFPRTIAVFLAFTCAHAGSPDLSEGFFNDPNKVIVFFGDSITANGGYINALKALLLKRFPSMKAVVVNRGKSSETVAGLTESDHPGPRPVLFDRLAEELRTYRPNLIFACYGMNDGIYHPYAEERMAPYRAGIQKLLAEAAKSGAPVILLTPPPFDSLGGLSKLKSAPPYGYKTPYRNYDSVLTAYGEWLLDLDGPAQMVIDIHAPVESLAVAERKKNPGFTLTSDGIHPGTTGHQWMAAAINDGLFAAPTGLRPVLPAVTISAGRAGGTRFFNLLGRVMPATVPFASRAMARQSFGQK